MVGDEVMDYQLLKILKQYGDLELSAIHLNEGRLADGIRPVGISADVVEEIGRGIFCATWLGNTIGWTWMSSMPDSAGCMHA